MASYRSFLLVSFAVLCWDASVSAQTFPGQYQQPTQAQIQPRVQQQPIQSQPILVQPTQTQPIQVLPMQTQPFDTQGGHSVYQTPPQPMGQPNMGQPNNMGPVRMAANPVISPTAGQPTGQPIPLYNPGAERTPQIVQPGTVQPGAVQPGMVQPGVGQPVNRVEPFILNPTEQRELDEFLARWEKYSANIKRYDAEFNLFIYDPTIPGAKSGVAHKTCYGHFKYIASPMRFLYVVEGEWLDNNTRRVAHDDKNPHIYAEKILITEKTVFKYDFNSKTLHQIDVPPEMIGKGIADSPLPLIFGAKADELKRRFSMKVEHLQDGTIALYARPLLIEDQQEFKELLVLLEKDLKARGLMQHDINGKGHRTFQLTSVKTNDRLIQILEDIKEKFTPDVPRGWKHEVYNWVPQPAPAAAVPQMPVGQPPQGFNSQPVPLYQR